MWTKQNYYSYTEQLLFGTLLPIKYFAPFFKTTIILLSNYYFGNRKGLLDLIQTKKYFWVVTVRVFFQRFYSLMKSFFLNSLEQRDTVTFRNCSTVVFAFWRGYVKGVEWLCIQFVIVGALVTWAIYTQGQLLLWSSLIVGALVTWAIYTQGQLLLWSGLIITGVVPGYK